MTFQFILGYLAPSLKRILVLEIECVVYQYFLDWIGGVTFLLFFVFVHARSGAAAPAAARDWGAAQL